MLPLLLGTTLPLLRIHVAWGFENDHPEIESLGALALATEVIVIGTLAALLGMLLSSFSRRRGERWRFLRIASWAINGLAAILGIAWIALLLIGNAMT
ncbi:hypothetical protein [Luteolibacter luteus]|uniref:Uncharacterized protein n=1 Tax=Luteolibacter luteus TaxID=2728835 RepID=A0A858RPU6_9BACT|nr:hypothetical protein [Luteolibacter luteus]QJE98892.1 hypothetical protein HHL09_24960 [Luteolibacter luteus]